MSSSEYPSLIDECGTAEMINTADKSSEDILAQSGLNGSNVGEVLLVNITTSDNTTNTLQGSVFLFLFDNKKMK